MYHHFIRRQYNVTTTLAYCHTYVVFTSYCTSLYTNVNTTSLQRCFMVTLWLLFLYFSTLVFNVYTTSLQRCLNVRMYHHFIRRQYNVNTTLAYCHTYVVFTSYFTSLYTNINTTSLQRCFMVTLGLLFLYFSTLFFNVYTTSLQRCLNVRMYHHFIRR